LDNLLSQAKILNEIEDNEEEEEEDEDGGKDTTLITLVNNVPNHSVEDVHKEENKDASIILLPNEKSNITKKESGETNRENTSKDENGEVKKFRGRQSVKKSRKTIKIAEDMKKDIDEMLNKKKKELEKIEED